MNISCHDEEYKTRLPGIFGKSEQFCHIPFGSLEFRSYAIGSPYSLAVRQRQLRYVLFVRGRAEPGHFHRIDGV